LPPHAIANTSARVAIALGVSLDELAGIGTTEPEPAKKWKDKQA
jgi:hypothetical protein